MTSTPLLPQPGRAAARCTADASMSEFSDHERFWPSRRGHAFDEFCR